MTITTTTATEIPATFKPIHVMWSAHPTKQHLPDDDTDEPGTGPDGWGLYEEDEESEGYFAWFHHKAEAENVVEQHNAAVADAESLEFLRDELEFLRDEIGHLPIAVSPDGTVFGTPDGALSADQVPGVAEAWREKHSRAQRRGEG